MNAKVKTYSTIEDYFILEAESDVKHEYIDGDIRAMTGGTYNHSVIPVNASTTLRYQLRGSICRVHNSDMLVRIKDSTYLYPDFSISCGKPVLERNSQVLCNPILVAEVTSPSSDAYDRGRKRDFYFSVPSIQYYLVIDQNRVLVELNTRMEIGWVMDQYRSADDIVQLPKINCALPLADVYESITFEE